ncbi:MAG: hypothetical protein C5B52_04785 [Bacteroidetes bacterium]|nr:MAG: hypothetical protein C5B52_04785 [Bacteroidota bacterium]
MDGLKNSIFLIIIMIAVSSCGLFKPVSNSSNVSGENVTKKSEDSRFLNNISTEGKTGSSSTSIEAPTKDIPVSSNSLFPSGIEQGEQMQFKYAIRMNVEVESINNLALYQYIESWWATPYRMGGSTHNGIDCSAFVQMLMSTVYGVDIPRTAREQKQMTASISSKELKEGDLVFFNTRGGISHVGVYLRNNKFVHAATSGGVMISDLDDPYWSHRYRGAGRVTHDQTITSTH